MIYSKRDATQEEMKPENIATCYMCAATATSREHAPPRCLFPEFKEVAVDLRKNLITVPSCDRHNSEKSKDDEFLRSVIVMMIGNNAFAEHVFMRKFLAAVRRAPGAHQYCLPTEDQ